MFFASCEHFDGLETSCVQLLLFHLLRYELSAQVSRLAAVAAVAVATLSVAVTPGSWFDPCWRLFRPTPAVSAR